MTKRHKARGLRLALLIALSMLLSLLLPPLSSTALAGYSAAAGDDSVPVLSTGVRVESSGGIAAAMYDVTCGQSEARKMLPLVNSFRRGSEAWWYADDSKAGKVSAGSLSELTYDYTLERIATMRAAEAAIFFAHTRPNGTSCSSIVPAGYSYCGENLAAGYSTAQATMEQWKETNYGYSGQGHRRNMLGSEYNAIGIGHVVFRGMHFWAQELAYASAPDTSYAAPYDEGVTVLTGVREEYLATQVSPASKPSVVKLKGFGDVADMPLAECKGVILRSDALDSGTWPAQSFTMSVLPAWTMDNGAVAEIVYGQTGDTVRAKCSYGLTTCRGEVFGKQVEATIDVGPFSDVLPGTAHRSDIEWTHAQGVSQGWGPDSSGWRQFRPYENVKRADMAAFLYRLGESMGVVDSGYVPSAAAKARFFDVGDKTPHKKEIWWLAETGISEGWGVGGGRHEFRPYADIKRQDMAAFLFRLAQLAGRGGASDSWEASAQSQARFRDVDPSRTDNHHREVWWLAQTGVSEGWDLGGGIYEFRGLQDTKRCDMAAFLKRTGQLS